MITFEHVHHLWDDARVPDDRVGQLVYRSNLLGADGRLTNYGGGNTSVKDSGRDPVTGAPLRLLWIKGSGGDLGGLTRAGLAVLDLDRGLALGRPRGGRPAGPRPGRAGGGRRGAGPAPAPGGRRDAAAARPGVGRPARRGALQRRRGRARPDRTLRAAPPGPAGHLVPRPLPARQAAPAPARPRPRRRPRRARRPAGRGVRRLPARVRRVLPRARRPGVAAHALVRAGGGA